MAEPTKIRELQDVILGLTSEADARRAALASRLLQLASEAKRDAGRQLEARDADWNAGRAQGLLEAARLIAEGDDDS